MVVWIIEAKCVASKGKPQQEIGLKRNHVQVSVCASESKMSNR